MSETVEKWRIRKDVIMHAYTDLKTPANSYSEWRWSWVVSHPNGLTISVATWDRAIEVVNEELQRNNDLEKIPE